MNPNDLKQVLDALREKLPQWTQGRALHIFAGIEYVAFQNKDGEWYLKTSQCNLCGKCCQNVGEAFTFPSVNGQCIHLKKEPGNNSQWLCGLKISRPFGCCIGIPSKERHPYCTEEFEVLTDG